MNQLRVGATEKCHSSCIETTGKIKCSILIITVHRGDCRIMICIDYIYQQPKCGV